jgi:hypothetical protein
MEQMAPALDSQMTGAGSRRHWHREEGCADRDGTVNEGVESKTVHMHLNPMNAPATPAASTTAKEEDETEEQGVNALSDAEHRAANRLGVLYGIYKPACFYFDIINIFHVRLFAP